jgi:plasmid maintenance system killer protein
MIVSFRDKRTREFAGGKWPDRSPGPVNVEIVDYH